MSRPTPFTSLLVANRGEIALRIMRTARAMGLEVIAVYTDADRDSPHVAYADCACRIGAGPVGESYLSAAAILRAARDSGADAIHPGYGFLSENADFARAARAAGLVFVGPAAETIALMGDKQAARRAMIAAGIACVPGYEGADQDEATLRRAALGLGYPVMIKAVAGGGGRGLRRINAPEDLGDGLARAQAEARTAFGDARVILERVIAPARHVEVQIMADRMGNVVALGARDCSVQRRHQKIIEESPPPGLSATLLADLGATAQKIARAVPYEGAGTVEFLLDDAGRFYFLEMNTRLQVEHPVTEAVSGLDLVALQLDIAAGRPLELSGGAVPCNGHAIEARLYAEDPAAGFLPSGGTITAWQAPQGAGIRVDAGVVTGQAISPHFDPLLAKIIAHGTSREEARRRLVAALSQTHLSGIRSNRAFLRDLLMHPEFIQGAVATSFVQDHAGDLRALDPTLSTAEIALVAVLLARHLQQNASARALPQAPELLGWGSPGVLVSHLSLGHRDARHDLVLKMLPDGTTLVADGADCMRVTQDAGGVWRVGGRRFEVLFSALDGARLSVITPARDIEILYLSAARVGAAPKASGRIYAPMHGLIAEIGVKTGDRVTPETRVAVLEAMKMQHALLAGISGRVCFVRGDPGAQVKAGELLVEIAPDMPE